MCRNSKVIPKPSQKARACKSWFYSFDIKTLSILNGSSRLCISAQAYIGRSLLCLVTYYINTWTVRYFRQTEAACLIEVFYIIGLMHSNVDTLIHCESSYLSVVQSESDNKSFSRQILRLSCLTGTYTLTPSGGSHTHSPDVRLAYILSRVRGSIISTHSHLKCTR